MALLRRSRRPPCGRYRRGLGLDADIAKTARMTQGGLTGRPRGRKFGRRRPAEAKTRTVVIATRLRVRTILKEDRDIRQMTISIAWIRKSGMSRELIVASDSRLTSVGHVDICQKVFPLPRG